MNRSRFESSRIAPTITGCVAGVSRANFETIEQMANALDTSQDDGIAVIIALLKRRRLRPLMLRVNYGNEMNCDLNINITGI